MTHQPAKHIIVVLGRNNLNETMLSESAQSRVAAAVGLYKQLAAGGGRTKVVCTGGSNAATRCYKKHHALYLADALKAAGVPGEAIITDAVDSANTLQDAQHVKPIVERYGDHDTLVYVVTSQFHIPRAMATFRREMPKYRLLSCIAKNVPEEDQLAEGEAQKLLDYFPNADPYALLTQKEMACVGYCNGVWAERRKQCMDSGGRTVS